MGASVWAAEAFRNRELPAERVRVYEKVRQGVWVYIGVLRLVDAWQEDSSGRLVLKFRLELTNKEVDETSASHPPSSTPE